MNQFNQKTDDGRTAAIKMSNYMFRFTTEYFLTTAMPAIINRNKFIEMKIWLLCFSCIQCIHDNKGQRTQVDQVLMPGPSVFCIWKPFFIVAKLSPCHSVAGHILSQFFQHSNAQAHNDDNAPFSRKCLLPLFSHWFYFVFLLFCALRAFICQGLLTFLSGL